MRIIRFVDEMGKTCWGCPEPGDVAHVMEGDPWAGLVSTGRQARVRQLLPPLTPPNIFCVGLNYREHARESNAPIPEHPVLFMKPTTTLIGQGQAIPIPACCVLGPEVDYECELAVVIGKEARNVKPDQALGHVLGYCAANDISARRWQKHNGGQWVRAKSFDGFCPLGPALVTADEIPDPQNLTIRTLLNDQVMQSHTTADMIFSVAQIIHFISMDTTLLPGTLILTGTPAGVGFTRQPPVWLRPGDQVVVEVERIGRLANVVTGPARPA